MLASVLFVVGMQMRLHLHLALHAVLHTLFGIEARYEGCSPASSAHYS